MNPAPYIQTLADIGELTDIRSRPHALAMIALARTVLDPSTRWTFTNGSESADVSAPCYPAAMAKLPTPARRHWRLTSVR